MNLTTKKQLEISASQLYIKLKKLNIDSIEISDYNKNYLDKYIRNYNFYIYYYLQLLFKAIQKLEKPVEESTFIDYGGGSGLLSYLASLVGFKTVIYNDIYSISIDDVKVISESLNINVDYFFCGDIKELINKLRLNSVSPNLMCSFDVLEHIYNLDNWFDDFSKLNNCQLLFMTSANPKNYLINYRLKKLHKKAEYSGFKKDLGWKKSDIHSSYLAIRKNLIKKEFPSLRNTEIELLAKKTRGLRKDDIEKVVKVFIQNGKINYSINHPTNTCDPYSGNWTEHLINLKEFKSTLISKGFNVEFTNSLYSLSLNKNLNILKKILNLILKILGSKNLSFSPNFVLEVTKSKKHDL